MDKSDKYVQYLLSCGKPDKQRALALLIAKDYWEGKRPNLPPDVAVHCSYIQYIERQITNGANAEVIYKRRLKSDAVRYIKWVDAGLIIDKSPNATIADRFDVTPTAVSKWKTAFYNTIPSAEEEYQSRLDIILNDIADAYDCLELEPELRPESWVKTIMESSGRAYKTIVQANSKTS